MGLKQITAEEGKVGFKETFGNFGSYVEAFDRLKFDGCSLEESESRDLSVTVLSCDAVSEKTNGIFRFKAKTFKTPSKQTLELALEFTK